MKILLIYPPYEALMGLQVDYFPISLGLLGGVLKKAGHEVIIYNAELSSEKEQFNYTPAGRISAFASYRENLHNDEHPVWQCLRKVLHEISPDVIGITSYSATHTAARKIAKWAKGIHSDCPIVLGGPYPTLLPQEAASDSVFDFVVYGEGEFTLLELVQQFEAGKSDYNAIKGLFFRASGKLIKTPPRERVKDLDVLPHIDFDMLFNKELYDLSKMVSLLASRGCPHRCSFCASVPLWGKKVVFRSVPSLLDELEEKMNKYKIRQFRFYDDTFTSSPKRTMDFCDQFVARGLHKKLSWGCLSRVNVVSEKLLKALEQANCRSIALGVESGSEKILKTFKKDITKDLVRDKVQLVHKSKLLVHLYFMIGSPHETETDILETHDFIKELKPNSINLTTFTPYYGTELYDYCVTEGILPENHDVSLYEEVGHHNKYNYFCPQIPRDRYIELVDKMMALSNWLDNRNTKKKWQRKLSRYIHYITHPQMGWGVIKETLLRKI